MKVLAIILNILFYLVIIFLMIRRYIKDNYGKDL